MANTPRCLRNAVSVFHVVQKDIEWRRQNGRPIGFRNLEKTKPIVAIGASDPLDGEEQSADYYRKSHSICIIRLT